MKMLSVAGSVFDLFVLALAIAFGINAITDNAYAGDFRTHVRVFHGNTRPGSHLGFTVQVHSATFAPTQVRVFHLRTNTFHVVDFASIVTLADHNCYTATIPANVIPAAVVGDVVEVKALVGGKWVDLGQVKIAGR